MMMLAAQIISNFNSQFIPNATIFFIVLVAADRSRLTIQSVGYFIHALDQKLGLLKVSFTNSHIRTRQLSLFALFRNAKRVAQ